MKIDIFTLFPKMFKGPFDESIIKRAQEKNLVEIKIHNLRKWGLGKHKQVDDRPFGGGAGMVMMVEPIERALSATKCKVQPASPAGGSACKITVRNLKVILLSPTGKKFDQKKAREFSKLDRLVLICGHYEGVDQRVTDYLVDEEISIGDYVLTGGELPATVIVDAITRLLPGVLPKPDATQNESFSPLKIENCKLKILLEYPQYTRPAEFNNWKVPEVLLSGDHKKIADWRMKKSLEKTRKLRPDLLR